MIDAEYTLSQLAFILGVSQTHIISWIKQNALRYHKERKCFYIKLKDLCEFLAHHRDFVGRLYFQEYLPWLNDIRKEIIEEMDRIGF